MRPKLKERYGARLEQLYATLAADQIDELRALRAGGRDQPVVATVARAVQATLGLDAADVSLEARFPDLGGDSLSALTFSRLLGDVFGVDVPVGVIVDPTADLLSIVGYLERSRAGDTRRATFASVHGRGATAVRATDLTLGAFVDDRVLQTATTLPAPTADVRTVLLTGATGFLGRFLALEWLERLQAVGGTLICLTRGTDHADARRRIESVLDTDPALLQRFRELADDHLTVLAGDVGQPASASTTTRGTG